MQISHFMRWLFLFLATVPTLAAADSLNLRSGRHVHGKYVGGTPGVIAFLSNGTVQYFSVKDVVALVFSDEDEGSVNFLPERFDPAVGRMGCDSSIHVLSARKAMRMQPEATPLTVKP